LAAQKISLFSAQNTQVHKLEFKQTFHDQVPVVEASAMTKSVFQAYTSILLNFPHFGVMERFHPKLVCKGVVKTDIVQNVRYFQFVENSFKPLDCQFSSFNSTFADSYRTGTGHGLNSSKK
jgi:hypothetical protein